MNYMSEVAKMLGVELGEEFTLKGFDYTYKITENGLICTNAYGAVTEKYDNLLIKLLIGGHYTIKRKPLKPQYGNLFFGIDKNGEVAEEMWNGCTLQLNLYKIGNCYKTRVEAEANRDKWIDFYSSDEVLEV